MSPPATSIAKSSPPLRVDTLVKRFGEMTALDGITLEVHSGECLGLLGPNAAGKSTLIRSIVGRVIPDAGTISVFGAQADSMSARTALGWVPQELAVALSILFAVFAGVLSAASNLVYVYLPELFPTDLRASGIGLAIAASRIGSAVSTFLLPIVVAGYGVRTALSACVAPICA